MRILGISSGSESGVAAFEDDRLLTAVSEERLSRKKLDHEYPQRSIRWTLDRLGWSASDVELICYGFSDGLPGGDFFSRMMARVSEYGGPEHQLGVIHQRLATEDHVDRIKRASFDRHTRTRFPQTPLYRCSHHAAHQAAAFVASPFDAAAILTLDGRGDFKSMTLSESHGGSILEREHAFSWESLGYFYGRVTELCGFTPNRHEGKVTGLAAHGDPEPARALMRRMIEVRDGRLYSHPGDFYRPFFSNYSDELRRAAAEFSREDLAAAAQVHLEDCVIQLLREFLTRTGHRQVCLAGGVFANVKLNQRIREMPEVEDVFVYPAMGDGGLCVGSVFHQRLAAGARPRPTPSELVYTGPDIDSQRLARMLEAVGVEVHEPDDFEREVVGLLASEQCVALVQGACEFGPRALGHRSILASPRNPDVCDRINRRLGRSPFMPFAPAMLRELAPKYLVNYRPTDASATHMTMAYDVTDELARDAPAIVHVDGTTRPQIVDREANPVLHRILQGFHERHDGPCLLNTSFNAHEEPILGDEADVVRAATRDRVDFIAFPPYLAKCPTNPTPRAL